jgi:acetyltransferase-like isoleucine patch superfamily enzyme
MLLVRIGILSRFFKLIGRNYYVDLPLGLLIMNFIFQRVFRINSCIDRSVHYGSLIVGEKQIIISGAESFKCLAGKGGCYFTAFEGTTLSIGENTIWAFNVCIQTGNHKFEDLNKYDVASVSIGRNCWIGNGAAILAGVTLGDNVVVGANSVVTKSFPSNVVIAGVPAKIIKIL